MMNRIFTILMCIAAGIVSLQAQIGIGTNSPDASSALDITSSDKGLLLPRMTTAQREAIASPANALMVFDTDTKSQWIYVDAAWVESKAGVGKFVDGATPEIAYYEDRVGIGVNTFSTVHKLYVKGVRDTDGTNSAVRVDAFYEGDGTSTATYGLGSFARNNSNATVDYAIGIQGITQNPNSGGTINVAAASWPQLYNDGNVGYGSATISETYNRSGTMTTGRGMDVGLINSAGASIGTGSLASMYATNDGTITGDSYGLFIGGKAGSGSVGGNSYALYLSTPYDNVTGISYGLYVDNPNTSYVEGNLGVGTNDPQQKVHISGVMRLEPQATPPTGDQGDLYSGTDGNLYFHDGTSWRAVQLATP